MVLYYGKAHIAAHLKAPKYQKHLNAQTHLLQFAKAEETSLPTRLVQRISLLGGAVPLLSAAYAALCYTLLTTRSLHEHFLITMLTALCFAHLVLFIVLLIGFIKYIRNVQDDHPPR